MPARARRAVERSVSGCAVDDDLAAVAAVRVDAGEDLEERRFAGAVLAAQPEDLAGARLRARRRRARRTPPKRLRCRA